MRRNGAIAEFNKLHWVWKFLLITGGFGVVNTIVRRAKCPQEPPPPTLLPPEPGPFG